MKEINIQRIDIKSSSIVQAILEQAPNYQQNTQGTTLSKNAGESVFKALPPNCGADKKHVLVIEFNGEAIGVIDVIDGYPSVGIAYLGLFLLKEEFQGNGLGKKAYLKAEDYILKLGDIEKIRLSYVANNPVQAFWEKMGFNLTGEEKPYEGEALYSKAILMEKFVK